MQRSIFDGSIAFTIKKPIRLIEMFAGYGSQYLALKYLGINCESWKICEWAIKSIQAYKDMHFTDNNTDYSKLLTQEQLVKFLFNRGISSNYNNPMTIAQINRLGLRKQRQIYNNIISTHNLVNIQKTHAKDIDIQSSDKYTYIMTYSFPCQDLSKAGLGKGMEKGGGTRSGMLWEIERILDECNGNLPQVLLMENVPDVIGTNNIKNFANWLSKLESLGYKCYWKVLNAKDYGVPQNRERCFMVSILGDYYYDFPQPKKLETKLKDVLEQKVDEKYYVSEKSLKKILDALVGEIKETNVGIDLCDSISKTRDIASTIKARYNCGYEHFSPGPTGILELTSGVSQGYRVYSPDGISIALTANGGGVGAKTGLYQVSRGNNKGGLKEIDNCPAITTSCFQHNNLLINNYRIRRLIPKECFRLMGVRDSDFERVAKNQSDASLYHLAGDSIVVNVLIGIFKMLKGESNENES